MSKQRRVVVTGIGIVAACGVGKEAFWESVKQGRSGIKRIASFDASIYNCQTAGEITEFTTGENPSLDRATQFVLAACAEATGDARLTDIQEQNPERFATVIGTIHAGIITFAELYRSLAAGDATASERLKLRECALPAPSFHVARRFGLKGPRATLTMACASGTAAIGYGASLIRDGRADVALAGGVDTVNEFIFSGFHALKSLSSSVCRPFDRTRDGMIIGEGAAIIVLEERQRALARHATIYAEVAGYGFSGDATHISAPDRSGEGLARAIRDSLADSALSPNQVQYINSHGVGTLFGDAMEAAAIKKIFGEHLPDVSSTKPLTGHAMGAAGAIEAVVCLLAINDGFMPGTLNHEHDDNDCQLNLVHGAGRTSRIDVALSTSAGFGGQNAALIFSRPHFGESLKRKSNSQPPRIVITGIGLVSHAIIGTFDLLNRPDNSPEREDGLIERVNARLPELLAADASRNLRQMDALSKYAVLGALLATRDAGVDVSKMDASQLGIVLGIGCGSVESDVEYLKKLAQVKSHLFASATAFRNTSANIATAQASIATGIKGVNATFTSGEVAGAIAIAYASDLLRAGKSQFILSGSIESQPDELRAMLSDQSSTTETRQTDGALVFALEREDSAAKRGDNIYCEVAGIGMADGHTDVETAIFRAMQSALDEAQVCAAEVEQLYPSRSKNSEQEELTAIRKLFQSELSAEGLLKNLKRQHFGAREHLWAIIDAIQTGARVALLNSIGVDGNFVSIAIKHYQKS